MFVYMFAYNVYMNFHNIWIRIGKQLAEMYFRLSKNRTEIL